jgi:2-succinyl-6-hydroxy-2,4-cyclohexadiene-1-carboxylate synthase
MPGAYGVIRRLRVGSRTVEFADEGPRGAPAVVLLHGFTGSKNSWRRLRGQLRKRYRVVAIDLPGHGGTPAAPDALADSLWRTGDLVVDALRAVGVERFSLVGYSMGGRLALGLALAHPQRVGRLLLESASPGLARARERASRRTSDEALARMLEREDISTFVRFWERLPLFATFARLPEAVRADLRRQRLACSPQGLAACLRALGTGSQPWLGGRLRQLAIPVTIVVGSRDEKFRTIGAWMRSRLPRARLETVPAAGHAPHIEQPRRFGALVARFLRSGNSTKEDNRCVGKRFVSTRTSPFGVPKASLGSRSTARRCATPSGRRR